MVRKLLIFCALASMLIACVPSSEDVEFGENSPMFAIQGEGSMVIALPPDAAPFAFENDAGDPAGFLVEIGNHFAEALEVDVEYVFLPSTDMGDAVGGDDPDRTLIGDETVHVAFPLFRVTEELYKQTSREHGYDVTTPFFVGHQRILVPAASAIEDTGDLAGKRVCEFVDGIAGVPLSKLEPDAEVTTAETPSECGRQLQQGKADAVVAVDLELLQVLATFGEDEAADYRLTGDQMTTQGYSPFVVRGMAPFASAQFNEMRDDGRWVEAYNEWIAPLSGEEAADPPSLTLEEAAALFPIGFVPDE